MIENCLIIRSNRKTISIQIDLNGQIIVRCPRKMRERDVWAFVESKSLWIKKHQQSKQEQIQLPPFTEEEIEQLRIRTRDLVSERVELFASIMQVSYNRITVRVQRSRWGSCSSKGNLNFNCLLALVPMDVLDYVVVHELAHLKQMNHSKLFWKEVSSVLPEYKTSKRWLKENGTSLISRIRNKKAPI